MVFCRVVVCCGRKDYVGSEVGVVGMCFELEVDVVEVFWFGFVEV